MWNDCLWPLVVLVNQDQMALQIVSGQLNRTHDTDYGTLRAGVVIPLLIVFLIGASSVIEAWQRGAVRD